jgi:hypothetical protein
MSVEAKRELLFQVASFRGRSGPLHLFQVVDTVPA